MDRKTLDKLEDLTIELGCTIDNLSIVQHYIAELTDASSFDSSAADGLFSICKHFENLYERFLML